MTKRTRICLAVLVVSMLIFSIPVQAAPAETQTATTCPSITHVVKPGETLYSIARLYNADPYAIALLNNLINPNLIYVGQVLYITCAPAAPVVPTPAPVKPSGTYYTVKAGDTLNAIARAYGVSVWDIAAVNNLWSINLIYVGQVLYIPGTAPYIPPTPTPVVPQPSTAWYAEYFNNIGLDGTPVVTRYDNTIDFHWGAGSPDTRINNEAFSARWTKNVYFYGGTYRFSALSDDGVRIYIDGTRILSGWAQQPETNYLVDVYIKAGTHKVVVEYYDIELTATIVVNWSNVTKPDPTPVATATPTPVPDVVTVDGWYGEYFANQTLSGTPQITKIDPYIGFDWRIGEPLPGMPSEHFSVRWTRTALFENDNYNFCAMADDGVRIWVDGALVVDSWKANNAVAACAQKSMSAGSHTVKVEYYEDGGLAVIFVWWDRI